MVSISHFSDKTLSISCLYVWSVLVIFCLVSIQDNSLSSLFLWSILAYLCSVCLYGHNCYCFSHNYTNASTTGHLVYIYLHNDCYCYSERIEFLSYIAIFRTSLSTKKTDLKIFKTVKLDYRVRTSRLIRNKKIIKIVWLLSCLWHNHEVYSNYGLEYMQLSQTL